MGGDNIPLLSDEQLNERFGDKGMTFKSEHEARRHAFTHGGYVYRLKNNSWLVSFDD